MWNLSDDDEMKWWNDDETGIPGHIRFLNGCDKNVRKSERLKIKWKKLNGPSSANIKLNLGFYFSCPILGSWSWVSVWTLSSS